MNKFGPAATYGNLVKDLLAIQQATAAKCVVEILESMALLLLLNCMHGFVEASRILKREFNFAYIVMPTLSKYIYILGICLKHK